MFHEQEVGVERLLPLFYAITLIQLHQIDIAHVYRLLDDILEYVFGNIHYAKAFSTSSWSMIYSNMASLAPAAFAIDTVLIRSSLL